MADALDDLCRAALDHDETRRPGADPTDDDPFDGWAPTDDLDEALDTDLDLTDPTSTSPLSAAACAGPPTLCNSCTSGYKASVLFPATTALPTPIQPMLKAVGKLAQCKGNASASGGRFLASKGKSLLLVVI